MATVFVGLSGGVDSALSAALMKDAGHTVVGCFIKIWQPEFIECTWREDRLDAMRVCAALHIPFREIDLSEQYKAEVIEDMVANYKKGITPNPDVLCNRKIKFGSFAEWAFREGADYIATGHYARINNEGGRFSLLRGSDTNKDQSYFLWQLTQKDLERALFPVGAMTKQEVRAEAKRRALPVAQKRDSQGLCFVGDISLPEFLSHYMPLKKGVVLDTNGSACGEHDGAGLYTVGQRHGFSHTGSVPLYVSAIDIEKNTITVSRQRADAESKKVIVIHENWIKEQHFPFHSEVQVRYREHPCMATTKRENNLCTVEFEKPHLVALGQSLLWYDQDIVLGGSIVTRPV